LKLLIIKEKRSVLFLLKRIFFNNFTAVFPGNNLQTDKYQPGKREKILILKFYENGKD